MFSDCHREIFAREKKSFDYCPNGGVFPVITDDPRLVLPLDKTTPTLTKIRSMISDFVFSFDRHVNVVCFLHGFLDQVDKASACEPELEFTIQNADTPKKQQPNHSCISPLWCDTIKEQVSCEILTSLDIDTPLCCIVQNRYVNACFFRSPAAERPTT